MKKTEIAKSRFYADGKLGLREVVDEGPQYKLYESVEDPDCLRYRCLSAKVESDIGHEANSTRVAFAAWAKLEVPGDQVQTYLTNLQAKKLVSKLSEPQRMFLATFDADLTATESVECPRKEHRVAVVCREKGIIAEMPDTLGPKESSFDVIFSPLGLAVLATVLGQAA
jgi:hypothetical protein